MKPLPVRLRLTLWYVGLLAVILAVFGAGVYLTASHALYVNLDDAIEAQAQAVLATLPLEGDVPVPAGRGDLLATDGDNSYVRIIGPSRQPAASTSEIRVRTFPIVRDGVTVGRLEVGQSQEEASETLRTLLLIILAAYPLTLGVAALGGAFLARRALSPVDKITGLARRISAENLGRRLDLDLPDDELGRLARTFDGMIERLDDAFRRQRRFTADASHELRTPLTVMKGQVEVALQQERSSADYRDVLEAVSQEVERLIGLAGSLLTLARADAGEIALDLESIDVNVLVAGTVAQMRPAAVEKQIAIDVTCGPEVAIRIDEALLIQLLLNLLDNAIKYTAPGGRIAVGWDVSSGDAELWVRDNGIGIAAEHLPRVMDRFYRVDDSRSRSAGGVGLGLAISQWIAEAHGGSVTVESTHGEGSTVTAVLPKLPL